MMKRWLIPLFCVVFLISGNVSAQDATVEPPATWPIVERCLPTPTKPDAGWTYDGEILMWGWGGVHAVRASMDKPYIIHWGGGTVSPDGQWILTQKWREETEQLDGPGPMGRYHFYYGDITVENIATRKKMVFDWEAYIAFSSRPYLFDHADPFWLDNQHFAAFWGGWGHDTKIGNVETGEVTDWPGVELADYELSVSPDQTRMISFAKLYKLPENTLISDEPVATSYDVTSSSWSADSSMFVDKITTEDRQQDTLTVFDRNGQVIATPFTGRTWRYGYWSPDNRYFTFAGMPDPDAEGGSTFLVDMQRQVIYDLCAGLRGLAWSPDGSQFATIAGNGQQPVLVVDIDDWQAHIVAYHTGAVRFWRNLANSG